MLTLAGLILSFASLFLPQGIGSRQVTALLVLDHYALFFIGLIVTATFVVAVLCYRYFGGDESRHEALYILLPLAALGGGVLVASSHFASFLLGLELLSISLFALIAYPRFTERPLEGGIKYLILAGFSSGLLLFGMALVYAQLGTMQFAKIGTMLAAPDQALELYGLAGLALIVTGAGFKLALVPFHMWIPDVYEGRAVAYYLTAYFVTMLLSLAGIPLTMGFIGKFYILTAGVEASLWVTRDCTGCWQHDRAILLPAYYHGDMRA